MNIYFWILYTVNRVHRVADGDEDRQVKRSFLLGCQQVTGLGCVDGRLLPVWANVSLSLCLKTELRVNP